MISIDTLINDGIEAQRQEHEVPAKHLSWYAAGCAETATTVETALEKFVTIPRADLPMVLAEEPHKCYISWTFTDGIDISTGEDANEIRTQAYRLLAVAEHLDRQDAEEDSKRAEAEAKRNARRDELARVLCRAAYGEATTVSDYRSTSDIARVAIDRIIELEEAAA